MSMADAITGSYTIDIEKEQTTTFVVSPAENANHVYISIYYYYISIHLQQTVGKTIYGTLHPAFMQFIFYNSPVRSGSRCRKTSISTW